MSRHLHPAVGLAVLGVALSACSASYGTHEPPTPFPPAASRAEPNAAELRLGELLANDRGQRRQTLRWNPVLARIAREKATDMSRRRYFRHTDPDGLGANTLLRRAGYALPAGYDARDAGNNVESLGRGYGEPEAMWRRWMGSPPHRTHLLGLNEIFARQDEYGIGFEPMGQVWVVIVARRAESASGAGAVGRPDLDRMRAAPREARCVLFADGPSVESRRCDTSTDHDLETMR